MKTTERWCNSVKVLVLWFMSLLEMKRATLLLSTCSMAGVKDLQLQALVAQACRLLPISTGGLCPANGLVHFSSSLTIKVRVWHVCVSGERFKALRESHPCCIMNTN
jgi:hypothetical protein